MPTKKLSIKRYFNILVEFPDHCYFSNEYVCKSLVCIKFLQMIVMFPQGPHTFAWSGSESELLTFRSFAFCMTERLAVPRK